MARLLLIGALLLPIIEIALFIKVGQTIGLLWTLGLIIAAGLFGAWLLRQQGVSALTRLRDSVRSGRLPALAIADTMMIGIAAIFLVIPGFLSDIVAIALLLPPVRAGLYAWLAQRVVSRGTVSFSTRQSVENRGTIELDRGDYRSK
jgi:UPF0716 protein FxsA